MATNTANDFTVNRDDIITESLQLCGVLADGESPTSAQLTSCSRTLNMLISAWQADGMQMYRKTTYSITLVAAQKTYAFGSGGAVTEVPTRLFQAWRRDTDNIDTPLTQISQQEYLNLSSKSSQSTPTSFYYEHFGHTATLYIWPTASTGVTDTLYVMGERPIYDFDSASNDADIPNYYFLALAYGLAVAISPKYGVDVTTMQQITQLAAFYKMEALSYDVEQGTSVMLEPNFRK